MVTDNRTEGLKTGEESRYIKQLEYHFGVPLERKTAFSGIAPTEIPGEIEKTQEDVEALKAGHLSASALKNYLECQARFYYSSVKRLKDEAEVAESIDSRLLGNVFHGVLQQIYGPPGASVTLDGLKRTAKEKARLLERIDELIRKELKSVEVSGRDLVTREVILKYVLDVLKADCDYMARENVSSMKILGLEKMVEGEIDGFRFVGFIDRLDSVRDGVVRVVDYKTGKVSDDERMVGDDNAESVVRKLKKPGGDKRPEIALQMYLYDVLLGRSLSGDDYIVNSVYSVSHLPKDGVLNYPVSRVFSSGMEKFMSEILAEIADTSVPFKRTDDDSACSWCDFKMLCGK